MLRRSNLWAYQNPTILLSYLNRTEAMYHIYRWHQFSELGDMLPGPNDNTMFTACHSVRGRTLKCVNDFGEEHQEG